MIDVILLRIVKHRKELYLLEHLVVSPMVSDEVVAIVKDFRRYFDEYPKEHSIDLMKFLPRFKMWHPTLKDDKFLQYVSIFRNIVPDPTEDEKSNIIRELSEIEMMTKMANLAQEFEAGLAPNIAYRVAGIYDEYRLRTGYKHMTYIDTPIEELLKDEFDDAGIRWRLDCLNKSMRGLRGGDFGIIAGRPDKGKTSFVADTVAFAAPQLPEDRNILWLNNEGKGGRIIPRIWQSALDFSMEDMKEYSNKGLLRDMYLMATGGRPDKIRVCDIHQFNNAQVEQIIDTNNPGLVVFDMIDNIKGFGDVARTDLQLEAMYQWARERSVKYDFVGLATSQISNDGDGEMFPTLGMLKDSKTGKQGACDFQLMLGASNDPGLSGSRYVGLPKNKLRRPDGRSDPRQEVVFDGIRCRFRDIPLGT